SPVQASPYAITSCGGGDVKVSGSATVINLPAKDVVLRCALVELPGTNGIRINAHSIKVDGSAGGSITANGKSGIQLNAGAAPAVCDAGATIDVEAASVLDNNFNGGLKMTACGKIVFNDATVKSNEVFQATSSAGGICSNGSALTGNQALLTAFGDI